MGRQILPLKEEYFDWLVNNILGPKVFKKYTTLCKELHRKKFRWFVHNDDNRCSDGLRLRDYFMEALRLDESHLEVKAFLRADCSVLEVMIALSQRANDITYDLNETQKNKTALFFLILLKNLRLDRFVDDMSRDGRFAPVAEAEIDDILEVMMDRTYGVDGDGGMFPLKKRHREDQSKVEIWYQMMHWLDENYS